MAPRTDGLTVDAATLEITDNDAAPTKVILSVDPATVSEGAGGTPITVTGTLDGSARTSATSVTVSVGGATATAGTDFATVSDFTLTINANATRGSTTFSLTPTDDDMYEGAETLTVSGTTDGLTVDATTITITDNDAAPTKVILSVDPATVSEGASGTPITVTGTLDGSARTSATSVTVSVGGATATAGTDFATVSDFTLTINANATRGSTTFSLTPTDDDMYEGAETLTVSGTTDRTHRRCDDDHDHGQRRGADQGNPVGGSGHGLGRRRRHPHHRDRDPGRQRAHERDLGDGLGGRGHGYGRDRLRHGLGLHADHQRQRDEREHNRSRSHTGADAAPTKVTPTDDDMYEGAETLTPTDDDM